MTVLLSIDLGLRLWMLSQGLFSELEQSRCFVDINLYFCSMFWSFVRYLFYLLLVHDAPFHREI